MSSVSGSIYRDLLVDGKVPTIDVQAGIKTVAEKKLKIVGTAIAGLQAVYKERKWVWPKLSSKELAQIK